jgi:two-component system, NarL family, sensor kinase
LEIAIMGFGLFYGFYKEKKESEKQVFELEKERTETLQRLIMVQDNERKRIATDLHDNLGPLLAALKINFRRIVNSGDNHKEELVEKTEMIIDDSLAEIRNVAHNLMPKGLSANGLVNTLNDYFTGIQQLYKKQIHFEHAIDTAIPAELQTNLYRIICELLLNAVKHSGATLIGVTIKTGAAMIMVNIRDDGQGFEYQPDDENKTFGLHSSESRVHYLKGTFHLQTHKGKGTLIEISIPLQFNQPHTGSF